MKVKNSFLTQFCRFQIENVQCFPVKKGPGETVLIGSRCDVVTCDPFFDRKSCAKNLDNFLGWSKMRIFRLILVDCSFVGSARTDNSRIAPSCVDDCTSFSIKSSRLMGTLMPDLFLVQSQLSRMDLPYSLRAIMLVMKGDKKGKKGLEFIFILNLVDLLQSFVAICVRRLYGLCAL